MKANLPELKRNTRSNNVSEWKWKSKPSSAKLVESHSSVIQKLSVSIEPRCQAEQKIEQPSLIVSPLRPMSSYINSLHIKALKKSESDSTRFRLGALPQYRNLPKIASNKNGDTVSRTGGVKEQCILAKDQYEKLKDMSSARVRNRFLDESFVSVTSSGVDSNFELAKEFEARLMSDRAVDPADELIEAEFNSYNDLFFGIDEFTNDTVTTQISKSFFWYFFVDVFFVMNCFFALISI